MSGTQQTIISRIKNFFYSIAVHYSFSLIKKSMAKVQPNEKTGNEIPKVKEDKINLSSSDQKKVLDALIRTTETMKKVKHGFGYSGQSTPNYVMLDNAVKENEKILDEIK